MGTDELGIMVEEDGLSDDAREMVTIIEADKDDIFWDDYNADDIAQAITYVTRYGKQVFLNFLQPGTLGWHEEFNVDEVSCWNKDYYIIAVIWKMKNIHLVEYWIGELGCMYATRATYDQAMAHVQDTMACWRERDRKQAEEGVATQECNCPPIDAPLFQQYALMRLGEVSIRGHFGFDCLDPQDFIDEAIRGSGSGGGR